MGVRTKRWEIRTGIDVAPLPLLLQLMDFADGTERGWTAHGNGACHQD